MIDGRAVLRETRRIAADGLRRIGGSACFSFPARPRPRWRRGGAFVSPSTFCRRSHRFAVAGCAHPSARARVPVGADDRLLPRLLAQTVIREARLSPDTPCRSPSRNPKSRRFAARFPRFRWSSRARRALPTRRSRAAAFPFADVDPSTMASACLTACTSSASCSMWTAPAAAQFTLPPLPVR